MNRPQCDLNLFKKIKLKIKNKKKVIFLEQGMQQEKKTQPVPPTLKLKVDRDNKVRTDRLKAREARRETNKVRRTRWLKNAQDYEAEYTAADRHVINETRKAKLAGGFFVPAEAKLILVTRIRG